MSKRFKIIQYLALVVLILVSSDKIKAQVQCYQGNQELSDEQRQTLDEMAAAGIDIEVLRSSDPNEIIGTSGYLAIIGEDTIHWVSATQSLPYTIYFENDPDFATAAAQRVEVRHQIHALGNLATFGIGTFGFGEHVFAVEGSPANYQQRLDLTASMGIYVDVVAGVDVVSNEVFWIFQSIDPETGLAPQGAEQGFLPVNDENHSGEGYVTFTIKPKTPACSTGDDITASASIVFDVNEAIGTNVWTNTIDAVPPTTQVTGEELAPNELLLQFSGSDDEDGCGIKQYKLYVSDNYAAYQLYDTYPVGTDASFPTEYNHCYRFISLGEDNVGNIEEMKSEHDFEYGNYNLFVTVAAEPAEGGTVTGEGAYTYNSEVTVTAVPNTGFAFLRWLHNGIPVSEEASYTFTIIEDMDLKAQFVDASIIEQEINLAEGWNWWSTCIDLTDNGLSLVEDALGTNGVSIKSQHNGFVMNDDGWFGNIEEFDNKSMYMVLTNAPTTISLTGLPVTASQLKIDLATNWTWISYPLNTTQSVTNALSLLDPDDGDMIKSMNQFSIYDGDDGWFGEFNLTPGEGYMYFGQRPHDLYYSENRGCVTDEMAETTNWRANGHTYAHNMSIMAVVTLDNEQLRSEDYEIAAFSDGTCLGSTRLLYNERRDCYYALLPVSGQEGMEVTFRLYRADTNMEYPGQAEETYDFAIDGIHGSLNKPVTLHFHSHTGLTEEITSVLRLFPNPVKRGGEVRLELPENEGPVKVEIYNVLDMLVDTQEMDGTTLRLSKKLPSGTYVIRAHGTSGRVYYVKLIVQ